MSKTLETLKNYVWLPSAAYRRCMQIIVDGNTITVLYQSRNLSFHVVVMDVDKLTEKHPKTKDVTMKYQMKHDELVIHVHETTDPYYLVDALNDALYNDKDPVAHDDAGFMLLVRKNRGSLKRMIYTDKAFPEVYRIEVLYAEERPNKIPEHVDSFVESIIESTKILAGKTSISYYRSNRFYSTSNIDLLIDMNSTLVENDIKLPLNNLTNIIGNILFSIRRSSNAYRTPYYEEYYDEF